MEKLLDIILDFADEHPILVPIINAVIASFVTTLIVH